MPATRCTPSRAASAASCSVKGPPTGSAAACQSGPARGEVARVLGEDHEPRAARPRARRAGDLGEVRLRHPPGARTGRRADPALIAGDERHFAAIAESLEQSIADLSDRLDAERRAPGGIGQEALDRDLEIHRLTARLRTLRRFGLDLCLGTSSGADDPEPVYIGRLGLTDSAGRRLLIDWRSPAAEPFFGATHANPMGLASRRRYRWTRGRISDYWDEVFTPDGFEGTPPRSTTSPPSSPAWAAAGRPDARRARHHPGRPGRHHPRGFPRRLVVDGGPGTGKTVVALHRTAYLLYSDPRLGSPPGRRAVRRSAPALPGLRRRRPPQPRRGGRADLHPAGPRPRGSRGGDRGRPGRGPPEVVRGHGEGDRAGRPVLRGAAHRGDDGRDPLVRRLAERRRLGRGVRGAGPGTPHNEARDQVWEELLTILVDKHDERRGLAGPAPQSLLQNGSWSRPSTGRGRCSSRPTSSATCGRCPPTCACALPGSAPTRSGCCSARTPRPGRCPTCRSWTRPGSGSATPRRPGASAGTRPPSPPNASRWPRSSTT